MELLPKSKKLILPRRPKHRCGATHTAHTNYTNEIRISLAFFRFDSFSFIIACNMIICIVWHCECIRRFDVQANSQGIMLIITDSEYCIADSFFLLRSHKMLVFVCGSVWVLFFPSYSFGWMFGI